jgi:hypothetical protein
LNPSGFNPSLVCLEARRADPALPERRDGTILVCGTAGAASPPGSVTHSLEDASLEGRDVPHLPAKRGSSRWCSIVAPDHHVRVALVDGASEAADKRRREAASRSPPFAPSYLA